MRLFVIPIALAVAASLLIILTASQSFEGDDSVTHKSVLFTRKSVVFPVFANFSDDKNRTVGFSLDTDKLHFGIIPVNGSSRKNITISNDESRTVKVRIFPDDTLSQLLRFSENGFALQENEEKSIEITAFSSVPGNFSGFLTIDIIKANFDLLDGVIPWM